MSGQEKGTDRNRTAQKQDNKTEIKTMKSFTFTLGIGLLLAGAGPRITAQEQTDTGDQKQKQTSQPSLPALKAGESVTAKGTIQDIDRASREITF